MALKLGRSKRQRRNKWPKEEEEERKDKTVMKVVVGRIKSRPTSKFSSPINFFFFKCTQENTHSHILLFHIRILWTRRVSNSSLFRSSFRFLFVAHIVCTRKNFIQQKAVICVSLKNIKIVIFNILFYFRLRYHIYFIKDYLVIILPDDNSKF